MTYKTNERVSSFRTLVEKIRNYFKYPYSPKSDDAPLSNAYQIFRGRLQWLNPFNPHYKGVRWRFFKLFFKVYLSPKPKKLKEGVDYDRFI